MATRKSSNRFSNFTILGLTISHLLAYHYGSVSNRFTNIYATTSSLEDAKWTSINADAAADTEAVANAEALTKTAILMKFVRLCTRKPSHPAPTSKGINLLWKVGKGEPEDWTMQID